MPSINDAITTRVGLEGLSTQPADPSKAPWIENMLVDSDKSWRPRHGLTLLRNFPARICGLGACYQSKSTIQKHIVYVATEESKLYQGTVNTIASASATNYPTGAGADQLPTSVWSGRRKNAVFAVGNPPNPTATERLALFCWPGVSGFSDPYNFDQTATKLSYLGDDIRGIPFTHGYQLCVLQKTSLQWSEYGDAYTWPAVNTTNLNPGIGEVVGGCYWQENVSYILGQTGGSLIQGSPLEDASISRPVSMPGVCAGGWTCIAKTRDKIFCLSPGPSIYSLGAGLEPVPLDIHDKLREPDDVSDFSMFYDTLNDNLCLSIVSNSAPHYTYLYNVEKGRWVGAMSYADNTVDISNIVHCGPLSDSDTVYKNTQPLSSSVVSAGSKLLYMNPAQYGDGSSGSPSSFLCALESGPVGGESPQILKKTRAVFIDGSGTWTVKLKHRTGGGAYSEVSLGSVAAPGWVYAPNSSPAYSERIFRVEAQSSSTLKLKSITFQEMLLGG